MINPVAISTDFTFRNTADGIVLNAMSQRARTWAVMNIDITKGDSLNSIVIAPEVFISIMMIIATTGMKLERG